MSLTTTDLSQMTLDELAQGINRGTQEAHDLAESATQKALRVGWMLTEAKGRLGHGEWLPWLEANTTHTRKTSAKYMKAASNVTAGYISNPTSLEEAVRAPKPNVTGGYISSPKPVPSQIDADSQEVARLQAEVESLKRQLAERAEPPEMTAAELMAKLKAMVPKSVAASLKGGSIYNIQLAVLDQGRAKVEKMLDQFTARQGKDAAKVLIAMLEYQAGVFAKVAKTEMPEYLKALEVELEREINAAQVERMNLVNEQLALPSNVLTKIEAKLIRGVLHPDKLESLDAERMGRAFDAFQRAYG